MEIISNITLEEFLGVIRLESEECLPFILVDMDGNWIASHEMFILDFYQLRTWKIETVLIKDQEDHTFEITLNGGNFKNFHFRNVHSN